MLTYHSTAHIAVIKLCTNDAEIFLHFHAFLAALSGMGTLLIPVLTSLKNPTEHPVVKTTEPNSIAENIYIKNRKNSQVTAASLSAVIDKRWNYLIPIEKIRILNATIPSVLGFICWRLRGKITFACVLLIICTHSLVRRGYCLWREKAWTRRFSADSEFLAFSCGEDHVSLENHRDRWSRSMCVRVCVKPWQQLWNQCCKSLACVTFWHQRKTAPPLPTTKGRGQEHVSCMALHSSAVENSPIKIITRLI